MGGGFAYLMKSKLRRVVRVSSLACFPGSLFWDSSWGKESSGGGKQSDFSEREHILGIVDETGRDLTLTGWNNVMWELHGTS